MKLKGKIYKHRLPALRLSVPEDFNLKWIDPALECTLELEDMPEIPCKHLSFTPPHTQKGCAHMTPGLTHDSSPQSH